MRATLLLIVIVLGTYPLGVEARSDPAGWQRDACRAIGVLAMKYPKGHGGNRGACVATVVDPDGDVLVPRHCIENALSAVYKPLLVPGSGKSRKYPVTGIYDARLTEAETNGKAARGDVIRIRVDFGDDELAVERVATAVEHEPKRRSLLELGLMNLRNDRDREGGRAALLAALQIDPDYYAARIVLAGSYAEKGEFEAAKMHLSTILTRWPSDAEEVLSDFEEYYPDMVAELRAEMSDRD